MFTPSELEEIPIELENIFKQLELNIFEDIIRRIKINGEITRSADWQIHRLYELGQSKDTIKQYIKHALKLSDKEIDHLYKDIIGQGYAHEEHLYKATGKTLLPFTENQGLQQLIGAVINQTNNEFQNITNSLGFAVKKGDKTEFLPIADYYQKTLDSAFLDIATGAFDYNTVLKRTVSQLVKSGLRTVDYASGWSNRTNVATRRAVMTGFNQVVAKVNEDNMQELETNCVEVSHHIGARPSHQIWQGKVYSWNKGNNSSNYPDFIKTTGYGTGEGLCGWNCYHSFSPFIDGVSERVYTDEWLDSQNTKENTKQDYNGKEYTTYEALQKQRKLESTMRIQREQIKLLEVGGADPNDITLARANYRTTSSQYTNFSQAMELPEQRDRVYIDGKGKVGVGKWKNVDNTAESDIIKVDNKKPKPKYILTKAQAIEHLKSKHNIDFSDSKKYPIDENLIVDCVEWLDSFSEEYSNFNLNNPCKIPVIKNTPPSKMSNSMGLYRYYNNRCDVESIHLNAQYFSNKDVLQTYISKCVEKQWYPQNSTLHKTFIHEYGHHVSNSLRWINNDKTWQTRFIRECISDYNETYKKEIRGYWQTKDIVSEYGSKSDGELFAETFAEYFGGEKPREFAVIFGEKLDKIMKGV